MNIVVPEVDLPQEERTLPPVFFWKNGDKSFSAMRDSILYTGGFATSSEDEVFNIFQELQLVNSAGEDYVVHATKFLWVMRIYSKVVWRKYDDGTWEYLDKYEAGAKSLRYDFVLIANKEGDHFNVLGPALLKTTGLQSKYIKNSFLEFEKLTRDDRKHLAESSGIPPRKLPSNYFWTPVGTVDNPHFVAVGKGQTTMITKIHTTNKVENLVDLYVGPDIVLLAYELYNSDIKQFFENLGARENNEQQKEQEKLDDFNEIDEGGLEDFAF